VRFLSRGARHTLALGDEGVTLALQKGGGKEGSGLTSPSGAPGEKARGRREPEPSYQLVNLRFARLRSNQIEAKCLRQPGANVCGCHARGES
jgi:hypothetical protein